jgi:hypothetical protein
MPLMHVDLGQRGCHRRMRNEVQPRDSSRRACHTMLEDVRICH